MPTVLDRFIQQAVLQVLTPVFDPAFSESSFGYRPGRSAQDAVATGRRHVEAGFRWVVDMDVEKFFDRVNHDVLMARVARKIKDKRLLKLIRAFLGAGIMVAPRRGDPARRSVVAASVEHPERTFLGYSMTLNKEPKLKVAREALQRAKGDLRQLFRRGRGRSLTRVIGEINQFTRGWVGYIRLAQTKNAFEETDEWLRRRCRWLLWRQWKKPRTRLKKLIQLGLDIERAKQSAYNGRGPWWNSGASHMNASVPAAWFAAQGLLSLAVEHRRLAVAV